MMGDEQIDSLSTVQAADGVAMSQTDTGVFVTVGGKAPLGGYPPDGGFLVNFLRKENWNNRGDGRG